MFTTKWFSNLWSMTISARVRMLFCDGSLIPEWALTTQWSMIVTNDETRSQGRKVIDNFSVSTYLDYLRRQKNMYLQWTLSNGWTHDNQWWMTIENQISSSHATIRHGLLIARAYEYDHQKCYLLIKHDRHAKQQWSMIISFCWFCSLTLVITTNGGWLVTCVITGNEHRLMIKRVFHANQICSHNVIIPDCSLFIAKGTHVLEWSTMTCAVAVNYRWYLVIIQYQRVIQVISSC